MKICFLDLTTFQYSLSDKYSHKLRGAETILINLSENLKKLGHDVYVFNNCKEDFSTKSNKWFNINNIPRNLSFDIAITNSDIRLLNRVLAKKKYVISYSLQSLEKFIRKGQLLSYLKHRPTVMLLGKYHKKKRSKLLTIFGEKIIDISIDDLFLNTKLNDNIDNNLAIFTSRPDRNLNLLIDIWKNYIYPINNNYKLMVTPSHNIIQNSNILFRKMQNQSDLIKDLLKSRLVLLPGHKAELFCLAAEEARELCIPIVTLGIGSLSERVEHGKTGFIANNNKQFSEYTLELFKNNELWTSIKNNLKEIRGSKNWLKCTKSFLTAVNESI